MTCRPSDRVTPALGVPLDVLREVIIIIIIAIMIIIIIGARMRVM